FSWRDRKVKPEQVGESEYAHQYQQIESKLRWFRLQRFPPEARPFLSAVDCPPHSDLPVVATWLLMNSDLYSGLSFMLRLEISAAVGAGVLPRKTGTAAVLIKTLISV